MVVLSDWSDEDPNAIYAKLKKLPLHYNFHERTVGEAVAEIEQRAGADSGPTADVERDAHVRPRHSDVTGYTYTFLMNRSRRPMAGSACSNAVSVSGCASSMPPP